MCQRWFFGEVFFSVYKWVAEGSSNHRTRLPPILWTVVKNPVQSYIGTHTLHKDVQTSGKDWVEATSRRGTDTDVGK